MVSSIVLLLNVNVMGHDRVFISFYNVGNYTGIFLLYSLISLFASLEFWCDCLGNCGPIIKIYGSLDHSVTGLFVRSSGCHLVTRLKVW